MLRNWSIIILLSGTTVTGNLFLLQGELIIVCNFFTSSYMPFRIYENLLLTLNRYNLCIAVGLPKAPVQIRKNVKSRIEVTHAYVPNTSLNVWIQKKMHLKVHKYLTRVVNKSCNPTSLGSINLHILGQEKQM